MNSKRLGLAFTFLLGVAALTAFSLFYSRLAGPLDFGSFNPGGPMIPLNGPVPAYWKTFNAQFQFPRLGFFELNVFYPLGIAIIIAIIAFVAYRVLRNPGKRKLVPQ